jgi:molecular chaperone GrpE
MEIEQAEDREMLKQALTEEKDKAEKYLANWQRSQADLSNYMKRAEQEKAEIIEFANKTLILNLLPILDDFEKAFNSVPAKLTKSSWTEGMRLIYNKMKTTLEVQGLTEIKARGESFDPHLHEAAAQQEGEEDIVVEELRKGYRFKDKLLRPSVVVVGKEEKTDQENRKEE